MLEVRIFGDPVLRQRTRDVTEFDDRLARLAADMHEAMRTHEGVGLAANQVGILRSLFTWHVGEEEGSVVNPVLEDSSEEIQDGDEGCLSFPGLFYPLERPLRVRVRYRDLHGDEQQADVEGLLARVFLHEMDHLQGILFIDHLARHDRKDALRRMRELRAAPDGEDVVRRASLLGRRQA